jgi:dATP pyrophosphohydrolase
MARPAFKRPESVLVVVHTDSQVLLLERRAPAGFWQSVTGSLRDDETPRDCACRELAEETGFGADGLLDLGLTQRFPILPEWRHRYTPDVTENVEHAFSLCLAACREPRLHPSEHVCFRWLPAPEAAAAVSSWTNRAAIRRVFGVTPSESDH